MKNISVILLLLVTSLYVRAQSMSPQVINSTGGANKKAVFFFDWSVGEIALINTMKNTDSSYFLTNGFLQPVALAGKPVVNTFNTLSLDEVNFYPNPAAYNLYVTVLPKQKGLIRIYLFDQRGGQVFFRSYPATSAVFEAIPMNTLVNGMYTLRVELYPEHGDPRISSYRVMKINK